MAAKHRILILDDEQDLLDLYREFLNRLPSQPEIHTANSGARALSLLQAEPFSLLITDLSMPNMDGFQVLTLVRRKFPSLRTVVMTAVVDEQYRARAYAMGIDLYLEKPKSQQEITLFTDCVESLLEREELGGFRGVQSKSLVDLIQLECLSQSSAVLRIVNKGLEAKIWIQNGDVIDAIVGDLNGEAAFKKILSWKSGTFDTMPAEPDHTRTIFGSYQGLLLDTAQALDEAEGVSAGETAADASPDKAASRMAVLGRHRGVEFVLEFDAADPKKHDNWGVENPDQIAAWAQATMQAFRVYGEKMNVGQLNQFECLGSQHHAAVLSKADKGLCVGFRRTLTTDQIRETLKEIGIKWAS